MEDFVVVPPSTLEGVPSNLTRFMDYSEASDLDRSGIMPSGLSDSIFEEGGEPTQIYDRWIQKDIVTKKYIDDVSGVEKLHASHIFFSHGVP